MQYIKNNIKIILFIIIFVILIILFNIFINREMNYSIEYDLDNFHVKETYNKDDDMYVFNLYNENNTYDISVDHKYTRKRKLISYIDTIENGDYNCISIKVYDTSSNFICNKDNDYYDNNITNNKEYNVKQEHNNIKLYNLDHDYLIWNGYGFDDIKNNKEYKFLSNESYTNELAYKFNNYIIVADYDQKHTFNKFYIYDNNKHTIIDWNIPYDISFDSYFMGYIGDDLYLFDTSSKLQYRMNISKKKIKVVSKNEMAVFFDGKREDISINKLVYNMLLFKYINQYNFIEEASRLYYKYHNSNKNIRISDLEIKAILHSDKENVYYLSGTSVYGYNIHKGEEKLLECFEWNFNYNNQIYVF